MKNMSCSKSINCPLVLIAGLLAIQILFASVCLAGSTKDTTETMEQIYPQLATGLLKNARLTNLPKGTLLKAGKIIVKDSDLQKIVAKANKKIQPELKRNLIFLLEQEAGRKILVSEAKEAGYKVEGSDNQTIRRFLSDKAKNVVVTEQELKEFYEKNKALIGNVPFKEVRDSISSFVIRQKRQHAVSSYLNALIEKTPIEVNASWIKEQAPIALDNPVDKARMSGKPTMVEFGANGCKPCEMMEPIIEELKKKYSKEVNIVFVHVRDNPILAGRFGVRSIPVQVFYDDKGKEVFRHVGFYPKKNILEKLEQIGLKTSSSS